MSFLHVIYQERFSQGMIISQQKLSNKEGTNDLYHDILLKSFRLIW